MTTPAKIEANKRNSERSTGPRTVEGKVIVSRNATKHGIFSAVPVIPGECPATWEAHRVGVVDSLAPVGLLEVNLAERAALLLWRLQQLARYEAELIATGFEAAEVPPLPGPEEEDHFGRTPVRQPTRDEQLRDIRRELRSARRGLENVVPGRDYLRSLPGSGPAGVASFEVAESVLEAACACAELAGWRPRRPHLRVSSKVGRPGCNRRGCSPATGGMSESPSTSGTSTRC